MSKRLARGGSRIDRARPVAFTFDGARLTGLAGDTLASALLANDRVVMGRSFKYHRPRGLVGSGHEEPNALVTLGTGARTEPNLRATTVDLREGLVAASQNRWPSLRFDAGAVTGLFAKLLPAGFYYKTFLWPRPFWLHVFEPAIRASAGLGRPPREADPDTYEQVHAFCDVLVAGGGVAGLAAALAAAEAGRRVIVLEETGHWGGRAEGETVEGRPAADWAADWAADAAARLGAMANVTLRLRTSLAALQDHGFALGVEQVAETGLRQRLWRIRAGVTVVAAGATERPIPFPGNDVPGVMLASAARDLALRYGVDPGRTVVVTASDDGYRTALRLADAGVAVPLVVDARPAAPGPLPDAVRARGIRVEPGRAVVGVRGRGRVRAALIGLMAGAGGAVEEVACDAIAMAGGWTPAVHLWSQAGGKLRWDAARDAFLPDEDRAPTGADGTAMAVVCGAANGAATADDARRDGTRAGRLAAGEDAPALDLPPDGHMLPIRVMPAGAGPALRAKMWLDFQNDVKVTDVELAAQEGYTSVEHAKRYTTLGMATDQGKLSNINGLAVLSHALNEPVPAVGTTTFRPPWTPVTIGTLAGEARGAVFQPLRRTPMHDWHTSHGAAWEPVGHWRRPLAYLQPGEDIHAATRREVTAVRTACGILDASTLGKILVAGPDAGRFLDMLYTGRPSTIPVGRCRYGLMCSEPGFLIDDGVVARLGEDRFLCHTTTGGADRIHAWMEDWLQCEWWDWQVHAQNLTEAYAQIAVAGPDARRILQSLGGLDLSAEALPFMGWAEGEIAGVPARVFRISFSGELSFELALPPRRAGEVWDRLAAAGAVPYGTEAMHVLRAEKGFIMIGDETDGTVIPQDLGLGWAIAGKKDDYLGKRGQARAAMTDPERWRLVGLETLDGAVLPEGAYLAGAGRNANGQRATEGRVTSTYFSPTLNRGIAMALVRRGPERMGETVDVALLAPRDAPQAVQARIVSPELYDAGGERMRG